MITYRPFDQRTPDSSYRNLLMQIRDQGVRVHPQQEEDALMIVGHQWHFDLTNGFPIITERDLVTPGKNGRSVFGQAIGELCAFLNGAQTIRELESFGCFWWEDWATEVKCAKRGLKKGDLGPGSYGPGWRSVPFHGVHVDQLGLVLQQMKEKPHLRTHFVSPWIPGYVYRVEGRQQRVVVAPCHGWFHVFVFPETNELSLHHFQRSADVPVGLPCNLIQYAALTLMLAQVFGYTAKELVYTLSDAHIYCGEPHNQMPYVERMLAGRPNCFPTVTLDPNVKDLFAFRAEHFTVENYHPTNTRMRIPTPV